MDKVTYQLVIQEKDTDFDISKWFELQSNKKQSLLYLIERHIAEHGLDDLSHHMPLRRSKEYYSNQLQQRQSISKVDDRIEETISTEENRDPKINSSKAADLGAYAD